MRIIRTQGAPGPVGKGVVSRNQSGSRRDRDRVLRVRVFKKHPFVGNGVNIRRSADGVTAAAEKVGPQAVEHDDYNVHSSSIPQPTRSGPHELRLGVVARQISAYPTAVTDRPIYGACNGARNGARMIRTMSKLALSNRARRYPVRILIFGQSISRQNWWAIFEQNLKMTYPEALVEVVNTAISGFSASQLNRVLPHCVYPFYPDLVIFHDYGGKDTGEWERMVVDIRTHTTAEILLWTDHIAQVGDVNSVEHRSRTERDDQASDVIRFVANEYNCELAEVREAWKRQLADEGLEPKVFLRDNAHLNERGEELLARLLLRQFALCPGAPAGWTDMVRTYDAKNADARAVARADSSKRPWPKRGASAVGTSSSNALKLEFTGNRVDVLPGILEDGAKLGTARVLIDGRPPSDHSRLYAYTLPSAAHGADWQPAIRRVSFNTKPLMETWTFRITDISDDAERFAFEVIGSETGPDGTGNFSAVNYRFGKFGDIEDYTGTEDWPDTFVSNSGRVVIDHRDFKITWAQVYTGEKCPIGFTSTWETLALHTDRLDPSERTDSSILKPVTVASGLENRKHLLEIVPDGNGPIPIEWIQIHRPPLE